MSKGGRPSPARRGGPGAVYPAPAAGEGDRYVARPTDVGEQPIPGMPCRETSPFLWGFKARSRSQDVPWRGSHRPDGLRVPHAARLPAVAGQGLLGPYGRVQRVLVVLLVAKQGHEPAQPL